MRDMPATLTVSSCLFVIENSQGSLARRLKDLEEVLKDRVEAKNERIVELNKQVCRCTSC